MAQAILLRGWPSCSRSRRPSYRGPAVVGHSLGRPGRHATVRSRGRSAPAAAARPGGHGGLDAPVIGGIALLEPDYAKVLVAPQPGRDPMLPLVAGVPARPHHVVVAARHRRHTPGDQRAGRRHRSRTASRPPGPGTGRPGQPLSTVNQKLQLASGAARRRSGFARDARSGRRPRKR
jgi:hypothetical protein